MEASWDISWAVLCPVYKHLFMVDLMKIRKVGKGTFHAMLGPKSRKRFIVTLRIKA